MIKINNAKKPKICLITFPSPSKVVYKFISDLLRIFEPLASPIYVITGNTKSIENYANAILKDTKVTLHYSHEIHPIWFSKFLWLFKAILFQIKASLELFRISKDVDIVIFYVAYPHFLLPLISAKRLGKKTMEVITRTKSNSMSFIDKLFRLQDKILFLLVDYISPESPSLISQLNLNRYKDKILPTCARFVDINFLKMKININERKNIVGYLGRLEKVKGVMQFVEAVPLIRRTYGTTEFWIGGYGALFEKVERINDAKDYKIILQGWIPKEDFPDYLNELKMLVLPTYAEGLPTIILEAMACGTPVLATAVGAIPDVIKDGETGFIMENNSAECIAKNVIRALEHPNLDEIVMNARNLIETEYTCEKAVERYNRILALILSG